MTLIECIRTSIRTSVDVPFHQWSEYFIQHVEENFVKTNKLLHYAIQLSEDGLVETRISIYKDDESYIEIVDNGFKEWANRQDYNLFNGISSTLEVTPITVDTITELISNPSINIRI